MDGASRTGEVLCEEIESADDFVDGIVGRRCRLTDEEIEIVEATGGDRSTDRTADPPTPQTDGPARGFKYESDPDGVGRVDGDYEVTPPPDRLADRVQIRTALSTRRGDVTRFVSQLEYWLRDGWAVVVRYDHDGIGPSGHDVTEEGLHRDVYRDGHKVRTERVTGPIPASEAFDFAEEDLRQSAEAYVRRFEKWHDVTPMDGR